MAMMPRMELRQGQSLVMTPQLQQAIKLLQLSNQELAEFVEAELERNPLLERDERGDVQKQVTEGGEQTDMVSALAAAIAEATGREPKLDTGGGTSDARFIAPLGAEVVEVGPVNATIHKVDERVAVAELERLPALYRAIAERLLSR